MGDWRVGGRCGTMLGDDGWVEGGYDSGWVEGGE